ncbi:MULTISPECIES: hypothetical protein [unclassified Arthrobacter]|uniref:hypothetical protein n=1 Tax=unclassified Arthrobacter TaxID=235627 RepID=UPI00159EAB28|nr:MULTISPECIES: hypothetical protein [unclassified Arthrobacter]MCQ9163458.1 hypothetical protein [Arthrobacter sp. STN4]NVM97655.1 hypothetical protein [Arthrobacter sp. SDTb3-6]
MESKATGKQTAAARQKARRRRLVAWSGSAVAAVAVVVAAGVVISTNSAGNAAASGQAPQGTVSASHGSTQTPPWAAPADASARAKAAGLTMLTAEGTAEHIHTHLGITADGRSIMVPGDIGIDLGAQMISPLHTHDSTGIIHVESPVVKPFNLGEVFTEWDVALTANRVGSYSTSGGYTITTFVNGKKQAGNPAAIQLANHEDVDIVITSGTGTAKAPAPFAWPAGY